MKKFKCKGCGKCCSPESLGDAPSGFPRFTSFAFHVRPANLALFDWEAEELKKLGAKVVPLTIVYDTDSSTSIVLQYTLSTKKCPFLKSGKCKIYDKRPLCCRYFPVTTGNISDFKSSSMEIRPSKCQNDKVEWDKVGEVEKKELLKMLKGRYGDSYLAFLEYEACLKLVALWAKAIIVKRMIRPAMDGYDVKKLMKKVKESKKVGITKFAEEKLKVNTGKFIEEAKKLKHGNTVFSNLGKAFGKKVPRGLRPAN